MEFMSLVKVLIKFTPIGSLSGCNLARINYLIQASKRQVITEISCNLHGNVCDCVQNQSVDVDFISK